MERERAHFRKNSTGSSELFICLSSSSSMKLSKSILSPGHRLRPNGSLKASPFLPKKRLDNPEPSSPKVTCIGQVRVKTKKKKKKKKANQNRRSLSSRRAEVSFRKIEPPQRSQGWVHLPVSICDALRTCFSVEGGDGGKRREIELVVGGGDEDEESRVSVRRRHVFEDIVVEEEAARVSICIPPKNALLLMRCRSDPMKMAALTNRFQIEQGVDEIKEEELEICEEMVQDKVEMVVEEEEEEEEEESNMSSFEALLDQDNTEQLEDCCPIQEEEQLESSPVCHLAPSIEEDEAPPPLPQEVEPAAVMEEEAGQESSVILNESILLNNEDEDNGEEKELRESILLDKEDEKDGGEDEESSIILLNESILVNNEDEDGEKEQESSITLKDSILSDKEQQYEMLVIPEQEKHLVLKNEDEDEEEESTILLNNENEEDKKDDEQELVISEEKEKEKHLLSKEKDEEQESILLNKEDEEQQNNEELVIPEKEKPSLPECLLLMMREPKLSMEVSRETWVCSTDFTKSRPRRAPKPGCDQKRLSFDSKAKRIRELQPPRSSCSLASMIEQKLANAAAHEPLVLTRCKSAPMRVAAAKLVAPESCFWKKLEPRAAGVGV